MKTKTIIEIEFGSEFQADYGQKALEAALTGIKLYLERAHKKNKVKITYEER